MVWSDEKNRVNLGGAVVNKLMEGCHFGYKVLILLMEPRGVFLCWGAKMDGGGH